jgi:hypothetical protein
MYLSGTAHDAMKGYIKSSCNNQTEGERKIEVYNLFHTIQYKVQGVNKIMETLRNCETESVLATLKEFQMAPLNVFLQFVYTL